MKSAAQDWPTSTEESDSEAMSRMPGELVAPPAAVPEARGAVRGYPPRDKSESLFEQVSWLYAFCREKLFRDDTDRMIAALWPEGAPPAGAQLIELGCGPGFYSCRLANRFPQLAVVGVDRSDRQLTWARQRAQALRVKNCRFERINVLDISCADSHFDALIASRLFTVLSEREQAVAEMHRVLRPGGRCFIAEPRHTVRASIPLVAMWMLARATRFHNGYREPHRAVTLSAEQFRALFATQPWRQTKFWHDSHYQYALCEKA